MVPATVPTLLPLLRTAKYLMADPTVQHDGQFVPASEILVVDETDGRRSIGRRLHGWVGTAFCLCSLVVVLSVLVSTPVLQLITFGYLLDTGGRLARGAKLASALAGLHRFGQIGLAGLGLWAASLPTRLVGHWQSVAAEVSPGSPVPISLQLGGWFLAVATTIYLVWAWIRGGRVRHYLWPQPLRFTREVWRISTWDRAADRLWIFTRAFELPRLFWLGLRGFAGTLLWLLPAGGVVIANRYGQTGLAGLAGTLAVLALGGVLLYLPMLQVNFAAHGAFGGLFAVGRIRRDFRHAPWAWFAAMTIGLILAPSPLYLLKIEVLPDGFLWLPSLLFVALMLPARIAQGLALRRARSRDLSTSRWGTFSRLTVRILTPAVVGVYLTLLALSQYTSWGGLDTWIEQHAVLIPVPFLFDR